MFSARTCLRPSVRMNKLIYRNVKHHNKFNKKIKAGILPFVFNIHNGTGVVRNGLYDIERGRREMGRDTS